ncbi:MAG: LuxR C-terminal-related transcriptional regulator [Armatimonadota bacterium]
MAEYIVKDNELALAGELPRFNNNKPTVASYARVSSDEQREHGHSLKTQPILTRDACIRKFGPDGYNLYVIADEGISGKYGIYKPGVKKGKWRPGLTLLTRMAEEGLIQYVTASRCDRISRKQRPWLEVYEDYLEPNKIGFFSATEPIDCDSTSSGKFLMGVLFLIAEADRDKIIEITTHGTHCRMDDGYTTGVPPFGWKLGDKHKMPKGVRVGISPVPEEAAVVTKMADLYLAGNTCYLIAETLNSSGHRTRTGKMWTDSLVKNVLFNPVQGGYVRDSKGELIEGAHFKMRSLKDPVYTTLQERRNAQARVHSSTKTSKNHIFGEMTQCGLCGRKMMLESVPGHPPRYCCKGDYTTNSHPTYSVRIDLVEKEIVKSIQRVAESPLAMNVTTEEVKRLVDDGEHELRALESKIASDLYRKEEEIINWSKLLNSGEISQRQYERYNAKLEEEEAVLQTQLTDIQDKLRRRQVRQDKLDLAVQTLKSFSQVWDELQIHEQRAVASHLLDGRIVFQPVEKPMAVDVDLPFILGEKHTFRVFRRGRGGRGTTGSDSLSLTELVSVFYYRQGLSDKEIAIARDISLDSVRMHKASIIKRTGARSLEEALEIAAPVLEKRRDEIDLSKRVKGRHFRREFTDLHKRILELKAQGLKDKEAAKQVESSVKSFRNIIRRIFWKLGVTGIKDAIATARELHLIPGHNMWSAMPTDKQMDVLRLLAKGLTQPQIAAELHITLSAVKERVRCMFDKFGPRPRTGEGLLSFAREKGWID